MWYRNNLIMVGKWARNYFLFGIIAILFMFDGALSSYAYVSDSPTTDPLTEFKLDFNQTDSLNNITLPINDLLDNALRGLKLNQVINIGTGIPMSPIKNPSQNIDFSRFFSSSSVSSNDLMSFLKEAVITGINLTILVISITSQVLKGILSVIK